MFNGTLCSGDGVEGRKETQDICHAMEGEGLRINPSKSEGIGSQHPVRDRPCADPHTKHSYILGQRLTL